MEEILSKKIIGERIKSLRVQHDLSQDFIAKKLSISRSNYSQIELGNQFPSFNTLHLIARYYSKSYDWILHGDVYISQGGTINEMDSFIETLEKTLTDFKEAIKIVESELNQIKNKRSGKTI